MSLKNIRKIIRHFPLQETWNIGIIDQPIHCFIKSSKKPQVNWLSLPTQHFFRADPFGVITKEQNHLSILFEKYNRNTERGVIISSLIKNNRIKKQSISLEFPFHTAYPYLLKYKNRIFCIPETALANEVRIYKAIKFPKKWEKVKTIVRNFPGVDSTIINHNNLWWLFCTKKNGNTNSDLYLFFADKLLGQWYPHPKNPIKTNIESSRPGGTPFKYKHNLYRPAQDCSFTYGGRVAINKIVTITKMDFKEKTVKYIDPYPKYPHGIHTISSIGNKTLIDGKKFSWSQRRLKKNIYKFIKRGIDHFIK